MERGFVVVVGIFIVGAIMVLIIQSLDKTRSCGAACDRSDRAMARYNEHDGCICEPAPDAGTP